MTAAFLELTLNQFQEMCDEQSWYDHGKSLTYPALGLAGETGEVVEKVKKCIRDDGGVLNDVTRSGLTKELGDVLFYAAELATCAGVTLEQAANALFEKANGRRERGTLAGSGDDR